MSGAFSFRKLWLTLLLVVGMNLFLYMSWWGTAALSVAVQASRDPALAQRIEQFKQTSQVYQGDSDGQTESDAEKYAEALQPLFAGVDWFSVSLLSSAFAFAVLGIAAGRMRWDPRYLGALPLLAMIGGQNPAVLPTLMESQGLPGKALNFPQQLSVFVLQMLTVQAFGLLARRRSPSGGSPSA